MVVAVAAAAALAFGNATVVLETRGGARSLRVEVARDGAERARGLMGRRTLGGLDGMLFVYPNATPGSFWMKDTLVPLAIAFVDGRGRIVALREMTPCRRDPCRLYDAGGVAYRAALEARAGAFRRWRARVGDRIRIPRRVLAAAR